MLRGMPLFTERPGINGQCAIINKTAGEGITMKTKTNEIDKTKRRSLIKNLKALAFMSLCFLPFAANAKSVAAKPGKNNKTLAVWG